MSTNRLKYTPTEFSQRQSLISVIIISWNTCDMTLQCIDSVVDSLKTSKLQNEIILVDNASEDNTVSEVAEKFPFVIIIRNPENFGFAKAVNKGIHISSGNKILLINSDIVIQNAIVSKLVTVLENNPECGIVGPALYSDDTLSHIEHSYFTKYPNGWDFIWDVLIGFRLRNRALRFKYPVYIPINSENSCNTKLELQNSTKVCALSGALLLIRKEVFETIGYFDEDYYFYFEDIDYCKRANQYGWDILYVPEVSVIHFHNGSVKKRIDKQKIYFNSFYLYLKKQKRIIPLYLIKLLRKILP
ncbi:MAG: hypothetical protein A2161_05595 [Candidatus Schekmanbacteria bacterium RBG_13_48_7]|uniref:Glycosyltransferase 2-like domain-containing protein n=1 Tax=Candidatus Schekmanbacteria bacterium RBG_13_48_7 TaxID=1817878 RepID=A0A1F7S4H8_9BACT|nr:MAG: hypothetical protein A2161_05595 [Candidatus Schekmanbacteria bacterium RBG_13_48_7]